MSSNKTEAFCDPCQLRFADKYIFEDHLILFHGIEIGGKKSPKTHSNLTSFGMSCIIYEIICKQGTNNMKIICPTAELT